MEKMSQDQMVIRSFMPFLPKVKQWLVELLAKNSPTAIPLTSFQFSRLPYYFSKEIIDNTRIILVDEVPLVPLLGIGVKTLGHFENLIISGVTYSNIVFIDKKFQGEEWLYFHELIHVFQWQIMGYDDFLLAYGLGLFQHREDYTKSFLEAMAYENHDIFKVNNIPFNVEKKLKSQIEGHKAYIDGLRVGEKG